MAYKRIPNPWGQDVVGPPGWIATWAPYDGQFSYLHKDSGYVQWGRPSAEKVSELASYSSGINTLQQNRPLRTPSLPKQLESPSSMIPPHTKLTSDMTGPDILALFGGLPGNWSGRGQHVEFVRNESIPLKEGASLGRSASADVHEVFCQDVRIARKQIYYGQRVKIEDVKRELDILKNINHKHVITLLGSYTQNRILGVLLYPAAVCDLSVFLDELDEAQRSRSNHTEAFEDIFELLSRLRIPQDGTLAPALARLKAAYGCITNAVQYLHDNDIRHKDLKPQNILLSKDDGLHIADFGISRGNSDASSSVMGGIERSTCKYCAPEIARLEPGGCAADIYALGGVFLEMDTVYRGLSLTEFDAFRPGSGDPSFQNSPEKLQVWMQRLRDIRNDSVDLGIFDFLDLVDKMLSVVPANRPVIASVLASLNLLSGRKRSYFGKCCDEIHPLDSLTNMEKLAIRYKKVKALYFEKASEVEQLQHQLANIKAGLNLQEE